MIKLCSVLKFPQIVNMYISHIIPNVVRSESSLLSDITYLITLTLFVVNPHFTRKGTGLDD